MAGFFGDNANWMYETDPMKRGMGQFGARTMSLAEQSRFYGRDIILDGSNGFRIANAAEQKRNDLKRQDAISGGGA